MKKELQASAILILIVTFAFFIVGLISLGSIYISNLNIKTSYLLFILLAFIIIYILLYILISKLSNIFKNKIFQYIEVILFSPLLIILVVATIIQPIITLFIAISIFLIIIFLPLLIIGSLQKIYPEIITDGIKGFITLSLGGILAMTSVKRILKIIYETNYDTIKKHKMESFIEYILNKKTIKFIIYLSYLLYMIIDSIFILHGNEEINLTITHSFLVILAFDSLSQNFISFSPSKILVYIMSIRKNSISGFTKTKNIDPTSLNQKSI